MHNSKSPLSVFIINLKKDKIKKEYMKNLCIKNNLCLDFIDGINGKLLSSKEIKKNYSKQKAIQNIGRELSLGEVGCALSHKKIYEKMIKENIDIALILEDDIVFDQDLIRILNKIEKFPKDWNIVLLGHHSRLGRNVETKYYFWGQKKLFGKYKICRPREMGQGTYGYIIKQCAAKVLLDEIELIAKPIDHYTGIDKTLNLYIINPAVIRINQTMSDNYHNMEERKYLQEKLNNIHENEHKSISYSWKRKLLEVFHLYQMLAKVSIKTRDFIHFFKKYRKYEKKCI